MGDNTISISISLQYQYNSRQTSDENKEKYQLGDHKLIKCQILKINIKRIVWQTVRRITSEILGVKGLIQPDINPVMLLPIDMFW